MPPMSFVHPTFGTRLTFDKPPTSLIKRPDDMISSPVGQYILDYESPHRFIIPTFSMFDGSIDPYDHMLHYNQAMILKTCNDHLLCKVFHKLSCSSINSFNELWEAFVLQYLCSVQQKRSISYLQTILK